MAKDPRRMRLHEDANLEPRERRRYADGQEELRSSSRRDARTSIPAEGAGMPEASVRGRAAAEPRSQSTALLSQNGFIDAFVIEITSNNSKFQIQWCNSHAHVADSGKSQLRT